MHCGNSCEQQYAGIYAKGKPTTWHTGHKTCLQSLISYTFKYKVFSFLFVMLLENDSFVYFQSKSRTGTCKACERMNVKHFQSSSGSPFGFVKSGRYHIFWPLCLAPQQEISYEDISPVSKNLSSEMNI